MSQFIFRLRVCYGVVAQAYAIPPARSLHSGDVLETKCLPKPFRRLADLGLTRVRRLGKTGSSRTENTRRLFYFVKREMRYAARLNFGLSNSGPE